MYQDLTLVSFSNTKFFSDVVDPELNMHKITKTVHNMYFEYGEKSGMIVA